MLAKTMPQFAPPEAGEIPLSHKRKPLAEIYAHKYATTTPKPPPPSIVTPPPTPDFKQTLKQTPPTKPITCLSTRGFFDCTALKTLITKGHADDFKNTMWDSAFAKTHNVAVTRPSHDAWGIKKVVLIFCDDFLQKVYHLPYWHSPAANTGVAGRPSFKALLQPVLASLGLLDDTRIVRMLLASLPPGVTIPTHHDTGSWVSKSHRIHVPIITSPASVLFRCGGGAHHEMKRVDCTEGRIFEMNNQAKHAVSNCWDKHRVHLILDYVDDPAVVKERRALDAGEELLQTRRSIDVASDYGSTRIPSYLIIGAQKSGTTTLFEYINQHPLSAPGKRRETHFFDWRWPGQLKTEEERKRHYEKYFPSEEVSAVWLETTIATFASKTPLVRLALTRALGSILHKRTHACPAPSPPLHNNR